MRKIPETSAVEPSGYVALGQAGWFMCEKFEDIEPFPKAGVT
jgi:hypothetical protein